MECKYCGAEIEDSLLICPCCNRDFADELVITEDVELVSENASCDDTADVLCEEQYEDVIQEAEEPVVAVKKRKTWQIVVAVSCCVVLLASLTLVMLNSMGISFTPKANDILYKEDYLVEDDKGEKTGKNVVATVGDLMLTNGELQVYYTQQIYEYVQYYGSMLTYLGLDVSAPLADQTCIFDETLTWQQYFINISIETWQHYAVLNMLAKDAGIALPETEEAVLAAMPAELEAMAKEYGFESADAFIQSNYGANVNVDAYISYMRARYLGEYYYSTKSLEFIPTDAEVEAYFEENQTVFASSGITKDSGPIVDVRHILIQPEGGKTDPNTGATTYSEEEIYTDEAWADALKEAEGILESWKNGAADQDSFAALATAHTDDTGSASNGGLYQDITRDSNYVEEFLEWSVDENRQAGDTGIVKTVFGYHIMYFVSGQPQWKMSAQTQLLADRINAVIDDGSEEWPIKVIYKNLAVCANDIVK